jgi:hypothetical protein
MVFYLIYYDNKDANTSSNFNVVGLIPITTTKVSHESDKEHSKIM